MLFTAAAKPDICRADLILLRICLGIVGWSVIRGIHTGAALPPPMVLLCLGMVVAAVVASAYQLWKEQCNEQQRRHQILSAKNTFVRLLISCSGLLLLKVARPALPTGADVPKIAYVA